ncbi:DUF3179 domain-containing protein [candidate division KSB1 bacterium]|nr:DUF3179 domain-containing protein [candidate division KSB1 bacterium]
MRRVFYAVLFSLINLTLFVCSGEQSQRTNPLVGNYNPGTADEDTSRGRTDNSNDAKYVWDVPGGGGEIVSGCLSRDCIPSLQNPELVSADAVNYLNDDDWVFGLVLGDEVRAYPHRILDWHEIINQNIGYRSIAVTYCPLTGTGVAVDLQATTDLATTNEVETSLLSLGVSGLLYNNNLIPYDRGTSSNWSQMLLRCVNGILRGTPMVTIPLIETTWETWKKMFPNSTVVSNNTGFDRPYDIFPYGRYKTDPFLLFPITTDDKRLPRKERVHGIVTDRFELQAKTYPFSLFEDGARAINDEVNGEYIVVTGMKSANFYVSYSRVAEDGRILTFDVKTESPDIYPFDLVDDEGNVWNILGEAISGPRTGEKLTATVAYNGYWFAWGTFFPNVPIHSDNT